MHLHLRPARIPTSTSGLTPTSTSGLTPHLHLRPAHIPTSTSALTPQIHLHSHLHSNTAKHIYEKNCCLRSVSNWPKH